MSTCITQAVIKQFQLALQYHFQSGNGILVCRISALLLSRSFMPYLMLCICLLVLITDAHNLVDIICFSQNPLDLLAFCVQDMRQ